MFSYRIGYEKSIAILLYSYSYYGFILDSIILRFQSNYWYSNYWYSTIGIQTIGFQSGFNQAIVYSNLRTHQPCVDVLVFLSGNQANRGQEVAWGLQQTFGLQDCLLLLLGCFMCCDLVGQYVLILSPAWELLLCLGYNIYVLCWMIVILFVYLC